MTQIQHSAGAVRAAEHINKYFDWIKLKEFQTDIIAQIIENETHVAEMLAMIEKIVAGEHIPRIDAKELLEKVRG